MGERNQGAELGDFSAINFINRLVNHSLLGLGHTACRISSLKGDQLVLPAVGGTTTGTPARSLGDMLYSKFFCILVSKSLACGSGHSAYSNLPFSPLLQFPLPHHGTESPL